jgi:hypothetical protein
MPCDQLAVITFPFHYNRERFQEQELWVKNGQELVMWVAGTYDVPAEEAQCEMSGYNFP